MNIPRRSFLKSGLRAGSVLLGTTLLPPAVMADWPEVAFQAKSVEEALMALFESAEVEETDKITITAPEIAENGAAVQVKVDVQLPKINSIAVIAEKNPVPLIAQFNFPDPEKAVGWIKTRIKMSESAHIVTVANVDGKLYVARKEVKVTVGGCGN